MYKKSGQGVKGHRAYYIEGKKHPLSYKLVGPKSKLKAREFRKDDEKGGGTGKD